MSHEQSYEPNDELKALAASRSLLNAIIEAAVDFAIITMDEDGFIIDWSSGAEKMFYYNRAEAIGQHTSLIFTPEDRAANIPMVEIETAKTKGRAMDERWHLCKDGSRFFMSGVMTPLREGPMKGLVKIARNITERKLAEEALLLAEERKSLAMHSGQMGEWDWHITAGTIVLSNAVRALLGLPESDAEMTGDLLFACVYPPDAPAMQEALNAALQGLKIFQAEYRIVRADNKAIRWVNTYGRIIAQDGDKPARMIGVMYDITPRKLLENHKDDFISMASHELKTPITAIKVLSEVLEEKLTSSADAESVPLIQKLNDQVDRLTKLIQTLLDSSTISEGKMQLHPVALDLNEAIGKQIEAYQHLAGKRRITWAPSPVGQVHADREKILQVVTNFVTNAIKYSKNDGEIRISTEDKMEGAMVRVQDGGQGIALDVQPYLFDRYYRVPGQQQKREGFGLGLYISSAIIKQHMGTIGVESQPGKGATFYFMLPYT